MSKKLKFKDLKPNMYVEIAGFDETVKLTSRQKETLSIYPAPSVGSCFYIANTEHFRLENDTVFATTINLTNTCLLPNVLLVETNEAKWNALCHEHNAEQFKNGRLWIPTHSGLQSVGADPEVFVLDEHKQIIPAWLFLPAQADRPKEQTNFQGQTYEFKKWAFWDGFQAEFTIPPRSCHAYCVDNIQYGLNCVYQAATAFNSKAALTSASVIDIPSSIMDEATDRHAGLGCSPSLNIYNEEPLQALDARSLPFRFAGFHIHYACKAGDPTIPQRIKLLDRILGPILISLLEGIEDTRRRRFYGKAGEYRLPAHGLEYRVPPSTVMCHPIITNMTLDIARLAQGLAKNPSFNFWNMNDADARAQHVLNDYDVDEARAILKENSSMLKQIVKSLYAATRGYGVPTDRNQKLVLEMIMTGCRNFVPTNDMVTSWRLAANNSWIAQAGSQNASVIQMKL